MKKYAAAVLLLMLIMAAIPIAVNINSIIAMLQSTSQKTPSSSIIVTDKNSRYTIPSNLTFTDVPTNRQNTRSAKALIYSLVGAAAQEDFAENEVKSIAIAYHTQLCRENDRNSLAIDTSDSSIFLNEKALQNKFEKSYTTLRSYCDSVYNELILISDEPADLRLTQFGDITKDTANSQYNANPYAALSSGNTQATAISLTPDIARLMAAQGNTYSEILTYCYGLS